MVLDIRVTFKGREDDLSEKDSHSLKLKNKNKKSEKDRLWDEHILLGLSLLAIKGLEDLYSNAVAKRFFYFFLKKINNLYLL